MKIMSGIAIDIIGLGSSNQHYVRVFNTVIVLMAYNKDKNVYI